MAISGGKFENRCVRNASLSRPIRPPFSYENFRLPSAPIKTRALTRAGQLIGFAGKLKRVGGAGLAGVALAALAMAQPASAQTATWTPAGVNAFLSNGANWDTGSFPNGGTAIFGAST